MLEPNRRVIISRLTHVELQSVFAIKVRTGEVSRHDAEMLRRRLLAQVAAGDSEVFTVADSHFAATEQFVIKYGFDHRLRTPDALHLAVASDLRSRGLVSHFVAAEKALCDVAALEQFSAVDPEDH